MYKYSDLMETSLDEEFIEDISDILDLIMEERNNEQNEDEHAH